MTSLNWNDRNDGTSPTEGLRDGVFPSRAQGHSSGKGAPEADSWHETL